MTFGRHFYKRDLDGEGGRSLACLARWVPERATVLELGPASGYFTRHLKQALGCVVDAVELDAEMADLARPWCRQLVVGDLDTLKLADHLPAGTSYQSIIAADVLEHLRDPAAMLRQLKALLAPDGQILISVPNVAYAGLIADLVGGEFAYRDEGLLDRTHLRFFTRRSLEELLRSAGLHPWAWDAVSRPLGESEFHARLDSLPRGFVDALTANPHALCYQWLVAARASTPAAIPAEPAPSRADMFPVRVFWTEPDSEFSYEKSAVVWGEIGSERQALSLTLPAIRRARIRLCLADRAGFVRLFSGSLAVDGTSLWAWGWKDGAQGLAVQAHDVVLQLAEGCLLAALHEAESWLELTLSAVDVPAGAILRLEIGWPMSGDYLAARRGWQDAAGVLQEKLGRVSTIVAERDRQLVEVNVAREERERIIAERDRQLVEVNAAREERERIIAERDQQLEEHGRQLAERERQLKERDAELADRQKAIARQDARIATLEQELKRLEGAIEAQERLIGYQHSWRGWMTLPWRRTMQWIGQRR